MNAASAKVVSVQFGAEREDTPAEPGLYQQLAEMRAALTQASHLAAIGAQTPSVAHDLCTPLGTAVTTASLLQDRTLELARALETGSLRRSLLAAYVHDMHEASEILLRTLNLANELVNHLKQFTVDQASQRRRRFDLQAPVDDVVTLLGRTLSRAGCDLVTNVRVYRELDSYPGPLGQILMNLVQNALTHAFPEGRTGCIEITARELGEQMLELEVRDNGVGMPHAVRERAFEPYFTTRAGGGGSGLGLHIVRQLATEVLGGELTLESTPGEGSRFILKLPYTAPEVQA